MPPPIPYPARLLARKGATHTRRRIQPRWHTGTGSADERPSLTPPVVLHSFRLHAIAPPGARFTNKPLMPTALAPASLQSVRQLLRRGQRLLPWLRLYIERWREVPDTVERKARRSGKDRRRRWHTLTTRPRTGRHRWRLHTADARIVHIVVVVAILRGELSTTDDERVIPVRAASQQIGTFGTRPSGAEVEATLDFPAAARTVFLPLICIQPTIDVLRNEWLSAVEEHTTSSFRYPPGLVRIAGPERAISRYVSRYREKCS